MHAARVEKTRLIADGDIPSDLRRSLEAYLERYLNDDADKNTAQAAKSFLMRLKFVAHAKCQISDKNEAATLVCRVQTKSRIKNIEVVNLPMAMLLGELRRKLPIQVGQLIVLNEATIKDILESTRSRIDTFLRKNGFYGAKVELALHREKNSNAVSIIATIKGGSFARVNHVELEGTSPITARAVRLTYQRMCVSFNRIFDAFSGSFNCYSSELEREATKKLQDRLAKMGYVQAHIGLSHRWLDPNDPKTPQACKKKKGEKNTPKCVDLQVRIDAGPRVHWKISMREGRMVSRGGIWRFLGSIFAVDQLSRITHSYDDKISLDRIIIKEELEKRINFIETKNVTETELRESAEQMREYLVSRGYSNAEVIPSFYVEDTNTIMVNFDVYAGQSFYVKNFRIEPNYYTEYFQENELDNLFKVRTNFEAAQLSQTRMLDVQNELKNRLSEKGFRDLDVKMELRTLDDGAVEAIFYVSSGKREFISSLAIVNGDEKLNEQILPFLRNCTALQTKKNKRRTELSCLGSALDRESITVDERKIENFYINNDYLFAKVRSELSEEEHGYKLIFFLYDGRFGSESTRPLIQQEIKDIILSGNASVHSSVIKRLFPSARKGVAYDSVSLKKGIASMREAARFSSIESKLMAGEENSQDAYLAVHVTEKPSLNLDVAVAFSTDQLLSLEAELEEENLFNSMLRLNTSLNLGLFWGRQSSITNKFIWPQIFGKPFRFSLHAPIIVYDDKSQRANPFRRLQSKIIAFLEWQASALVRPYIGYSLTHTLKEEFPGNVAPSMDIKEQFQTLDGLIPTLAQPGDIRGMLKPGIAITNLDNPADPHSGFDSNNWAEISGGALIGDPFFVNLGTQNRGYIPMGRLTLALQGSLMRAFMKPDENNWKNMIDVSAMDYLGGDRNVRGYEERVIGITSAKEATGPLAGYFSNTATVELRFPLTSPELLGNFSGAVFVDQGLLVPCKDLGCSSEFSFKEMIEKRGFALSLGAGLRYNLPVGPISLDYAYSPIHYDWRIHVQFGYSF